MARRCTICASPYRRAIEHYVRKKKEGGYGYSYAVAARKAKEEWDIDVGWRSIGRHAVNCPDKQKEYDRASTLTIIDGARVRTIDGAEYTVTEVVDFLKGVIAVSASKLSQPESVSIKDGIAAAKLLKTIINMQGSDKYDELWMNVVRNGPIKTDHLPSANVEFPMLKSGEDEEEDEYEDLDDESEE